MLTTGAMPENTLSFIKSNISFQKALQNNSLG
jgi:hypothetical protein